MIKLAVREDSGAKAHRGSSDGRLYIDDYDVSSEEPDRVRAISHFSGDVLCGPGLGQLIQ